MTPAVTGARSERDTTRRIPRFAWALAALVVAYLSWLFITLDGMPQPGAASPADAAAKIEKAVRDHDADSLHLMLAPTENSGGFVSGILDQVPRSSGATARAASRCGLDVVTVTLPGGQITITHTFMIQESDGRWFLLTTPVLCAT